MQCFLSENDVLTIGEVQINVLEVGHDSVKLGINDPSASPSYREEILYVHDEDGEANDYDVFCESTAIEADRPFAISVL